jgi:hypothetical protein
MAGVAYPQRPPGSLHPTAAQLLVQYLGFADTPARREYQLVAQVGTETRNYTVWIEQAAFTKRKALRQDGPDICYQKLRRTLVESALSGTACIAVTEADLDLYRSAHTSKRAI